MPIGVYQRMIGHPIRRDKKTGNIVLPLTPHRRAAIFWDRAVMGMSFGKVAKKYNTTPSTVFAIIRGDWNPHRRKPK